MEANFKTDSLWEIEKPISGSLKWFYRQSNPIKTTLSFCHRSFVSLLYGSDSKICIKKFLPEWENYKENKSGDEYNIHFEVFENRSTTTSPGTNYFE